MIELLPGTKIETVIDGNTADRILAPMFLSGGLVLSQVSQITGLEGHTVQNWIKRKHLSPPENKRYTRDQLCRIMNINILKESFTLDQIDVILNYTKNGIKGGGCPVSDSDLYSYFIGALVSSRVKKLDKAIDSVIMDIKTKYVITGQRLSEVLGIMVTAHEASQINRQAVVLFERLDFI